VQRLRVSPLALRAAWLPLGAIVLLSPNASYAVRTVTALAAATVLLVTAAKHDDGLRTARRFFAAALLAGAASGVASAIYFLAVGHEAPMGWLSDWLYLSYAPLGVAGVLAVPRAAKRVGGLIRALADGAVAATSLWYLVVAFFIGPTHLGATLPPMARGVTLAFPLLPTFVIAVILSALPRASRAARPFLLRAGTGVALLGMGDVGVAVATWDGWYHADSWIAVISEFGLLSLLDAALLSSPKLQADNDEGAAELNATTGFLVVTAPHLPLLAALVAMSVQFIDNDRMSRGQLAPLVAGGVVLVVRHIAAARETGRLVARLAARERLARARAMTDPLTQLANRATFLDQLDAALREPTKHQVAVALLDLNDFKDVNDTHGHDTGDEILRVAGEFLRRAVAAKDGACVARLGGDEFAVFVCNSRDKGRDLADVLATAFQERILVGTRQFHVRPSIGVVIDERVPGAATRGDSARLVAHADVAMYEAKRNKHIHDVPVAVLTGAARAAATATIRIREEIGHPDLSQFSVVYQPVVDLETGAIVAAEALLRWHHPEFGEVSPTTFIPLAERVGSVSALGEFVLSVALDDLSTWTSVHAPSGFTVGVNVSPRQLADPRLVTTALAMLHSRGLSPRQLSFELTEEAFADDVDAVVDTIAALRTAGIWVAVDDFGTGYSSLSYLRRFDANVLKIDREFVQACETDPRTDALVRSVVAMAAALEVTSLAEGIETLEQLAKVRSYGCRYGQGFALARPMPAVELGELLAAGHTYPVDVQPPVAATRRRYPRAVRPA
jgi:diguanylate cyclase (GGDEF)-like protein